MRFYEVYKPVFEVVRNRIMGIAGVKQVVLGEQVRLHNLPLAVINPSSAATAPITLEGDLRALIRFDIYLIIRVSEPEDLFEDIISLMCDIVDVILSDRTLSGSALDIRLTNFAPGEVRFQNNLYYGGLLSFEATVFYPREP
ncbi:MAG: hypothetical protein QW619_05435 [Candidatus Bathyarchaeia archaeon]